MLVLPQGSEVSFRVVAAFPPATGPDLWSSNSLGSLNVLLSVLVTRHGCGRVASHELECCRETSGWPRRQQRPTKLPAVFQRVSAQVGGLELGGVLAWLSGRVLGQYDVLVGDQPTEAEDVISYVGPNIVALEQRLGFEPGPFRLWLCLHESAHRAQFEGAPWVRTYFLGLIDEAMGAMPTSGASVLTGLTRAASDALKGKSVLGEHGLVGLVASEEQLTAMRRLSALMSVLEGHGEVVMDEAARDLVPQADHFHSALRARRADPSSTSSMASRLLGLEAKLRQYEEGERFVRHLRDTGGPSLVAELFEGPEHLPSLDEVRTPQLWLERASGSRSAARR